MGYEDKVSEVLERVLMECGLCVLVGLLVVDVEDLLQLVSLLLERLQGVEGLGDEVQFVMAWHLEVIHP